MTEKLIDAVLDYIKSGPESVSYIHRSLSRDEGWRGLGRLADFEERLRSLGFVVRRGINSRGQSRIEVTL